MKKMTNDEFIKRLAETNPTLIASEYYVNSQTKIEFICTVCETHWKTCPSVVLRGHGCPECSKKKAVERSHKTNAQFLKELEKINPTVSPLDSYVNSKTKIKCKCLICNNVWYATPNSLLNGAGCPNCGRIRAINIKRKSNDAFVSELNTINPNVILMEPYQGSKTKIRCYCKLHGIKWSIIPDSLLRGSGCPMCKSDKSRNAQIKDTAAFITELQSINQDIDIVDDYKGAHQKIKCCCKRCGNQWYAEPNGLLKGYGCPKCAHASSSLVEQIIYHAFSLDLGEDKVLSRDKTAIGKELDVYVPSIKLAFEYGAWVWHKDRVEKDLEKIELCRKKDIKLITIYDQCHGRIKRFSDRIIYIDYDLASDAGQAYLKDFILTIFKEYGLKNSITQEQWNTIFLLASEASKLKDNNSFLAELSISNPNIEPLESYRGSMTKIKVKCKNHGIIWSTLPTSLLKGCGCRICAKNKIKKSLSKTDSEFISELLSVNSTIKPVEPYRGYKRKVSA